MSGAVRAATNAGYKLVDTAHVYGGGKTEPIVGTALSKQPGVFLITKQWRGFHGHKETTKCLDQSLRRLGRDKVRRPSGSILALLGRGRGDAAGRELDIPKGVGTRARAPFERAAPQK